MITDNTHEGYVCLAASQPESYMCPSSPQQNDPCTNLLTRPKDIILVQDTHHGSIWSG